MAEPSLTECTLVTPEVGSQVRNDQSFDVTVRFTVDVPSTPLPQTETFAVLFGITPVEEVDIEFFDPGETQKELRFSLGAPVNDSQLPDSGNIDVQLALQTTPQLPVSCGSFELLPPDEITDGGGGIDVGPVELQSCQLIRPR